MVKTVMFTENSKLLGLLPNGKVNKSRAAHASYRAVGVHESCPSTCGFLPENTRGTGRTACYAGKNKVALTAQKAGWSADDGREVKRWLASLPRNGYARHHVSGDCGKPGGTVDEAYVDALVEGHRENPDVRGWGYSHFWRDLEPARLNFAGSKGGGLTFSASTETYEEALEARRRGWPVVVVLPKDEHRRRFKVEVNGEILDILTCPNQTTGKAAGRPDQPTLGCVACGLCLRRDRKLVVAFKPH